MSDKKMLGDFIYQMRKEKRLSQSELGEMVGVSNKAVSKWETCEANPDLSIIKKLAAALGVTVDELLNCRKSEKHDVSNKTSNLFGIKGIAEKTSHSYEFVSDKKSKNGKPYLHINFGTDNNGKIRKANGIFAIGIIAKGIISVGLISYGVISFGLMAIGLLAFGSIAIGALIAIGGIAAGMGVSIGGIAIGAMAIGGVAIGVFSVGGISIGYYAVTGEFGKAIGAYTVIIK